MLFALGSNGSGQLGIGTYGDVSDPQPCIIQHDKGDHPGTPTSISAGGSHTLILFDSGRVFSAGSNQHGQAGIKSQNSCSANPPDPQTMFTEMKLPIESSKIKFCSATWEASIIVTSDDEIYTCGYGPKGELGIESDYSKEMVKLPSIPRQDGTIVDIASGIRHTVVVLSSGNVYGWGNGRQKQLGEPAEIVRSPRKLNYVNHIKRATCGTEFTYLVEDPIEGRHLLLGSNKWGVHKPPSTYMQNWKDVGSNWGTIIVLDCVGNLVAWGRNDRGQLGLSSTDVSDRVEQIAVGSEHALALNRSGLVLACGWGEHGNCGSNVDEEGNVKDRCNTLSINQTDAATKIIGIAAGCATSFIWTNFDRPS